MKGGAKLTGFDKAHARLRHETGKMKNASLKGLRLAAMHIRKDMEVTPPLIPVDENNLRSSWFIVSAQGAVVPGGKFSGADSGKMQSDHSMVVAQAQAIAATENKPVVVMGFSANYALFVHESIGKTFQRPGAGAQFFAAALNRNKDAILKILSQNMQL